MITIDRSCPKCGQTNTLEVDADGYQAWQNGTPIQTALPTLTVNQREIVMSGIDGKCWDAMFKDEE
jgi:hypothetical protein